MGQIIKPMPDGAALIRPTWLATQADDIAQNVGRVRRSRHPASTRLHTLTTFSHRGELML
ncbi:hypothetical protein CWM61_10010 [Klebsiella sp. K-Nf6]|nr:hypothetical protein CWM61_10010 [Klebsiella sp. K-Nf6]